ncbi:uncharacterized protein LOC5522265 [Nematostella vectensis]|uniref:uncharacterized protein LOC5522265 n=1 Tax=Nematostella vectensis TaxID=45351 RepID=UPI00207761C0|nr:uncharacterized protein LOC5522265 [Nematostella vectensis]
MDETAKTNVTETNNIADGKESGDAVLRAPPRRRKSAKRARLNQDSCSNECQPTSEATSTTENASFNTILPETASNNQGTSSDRDDSKESHSLLQSEEIERVCEQQHGEIHSSETKHSRESTCPNLYSKPKQDEQKLLNDDNVDILIEAPQNDCVANEKGASSDVEVSHNMGNKLPVEISKESRNNVIVQTGDNSLGIINDGGTAFICTEEVGHFCWVDVENSNGGKVVGNNPGTIENEDVLPPAVTSDSMRHPEDMSTMRETQDQKQTDPAANGSSEATNSNDSDHKNANIRFSDIDKNVNISDSQGENIHVDSQSSKKTQDSEMEEVKDPSKSLSLEGTSSLPYKSLENNGSDSTLRTDEDNFSTASESDDDSFYSDVTSSEGEYNMEDAEISFGVGNLLEQGIDKKTNGTTLASPDGDTVQEILSVFPDTEYLTVRDTQSDDKAIDNTLTEEQRHSSSSGSFGLSEERAKSLKRHIGSFKEGKCVEASAESVRFAEVMKNQSLSIDEQVINDVFDQDKESNGPLFESEVNDDNSDLFITYVTPFARGPIRPTLSLRHLSYTSNHEKDGNLEISRERYLDGSPRVRSRSTGDIDELDLEEHFKFGSLSTIPRMSRSSRVIVRRNSSKESDVPTEKLGLDEEWKDYSHADNNTKPPVIASEAGSPSSDSVIRNFRANLEEERDEDRPFPSVDDQNSGNRLDVNSELEPDLNANVLAVAPPRCLSMVKEETASLLELDLNSAPGIEGVPGSRLLESVLEFTTSEHSDKKDKSSLSPRVNNSERNSKVTFHEGVLDDRHMTPTEQDAEFTANEAEVSNQDISRLSSSEPSPIIPKSINNRVIKSSALSNGEQWESGNNNESNVVLRKKKFGRRKWLSFSMVEGGTKSPNIEDITLTRYRKKGSFDHTDSASLDGSPTKAPQFYKADGVSHEREGDQKEEEIKADDIPKRPPRKKLGHSRSFNTPGTDRKNVNKRPKKVRTERSFRWQTLSGGIDVTPAEWFRLSRLSSYRELTHEGPVTLVTDALVANFPNFPHDKRAQQALELYTTERTYVRGLETILELFKMPLEGYLDEKEMKIMFSNIHSIFQLNKDVVFSLCERITHWNETQCVGDIFNEMAPRFKIYATYCNNYDAAETLIKQKIKKKKDFEAFLNACYSDPVCQPGLTLQAYLITVVQRIPRYLLLLRDLVKSTPSTHPDSQHLKEALHKMNNIAEYINNQLQAVQGQRAMAELRSRVIGIKAFETQGRALIKEGQVSLMSVRKPYKCLLFNDILVFAAKNATKQGEVELTLELKTLWVTDLEGNDPQTNKEDAIELYTAERSFIMYAGSRNEKKHWLQKLRTSIAIQLRGDEATDSSDITHRKAAFTYKDGRIYCGSFVDGKRHGHGVLAWQNRTRYEGHFEDNERNGIGVLTYNTGEKYDGEWLDDKQCGIGTLKYPNGDYYHGEWREGEMHGKGVIVFNNKDSLEGVFVKGDIQSEGTLKCTNGLTYVGTWHKSKKHGKGRLVMANGDTYNGNFVNDRMCGEGEMLYAKNGALYKGQWENSQRHGVGTYEAPDGTMYEGEWSADHIQGRGRMIYPNKDSYDGSWFRNMRFGKGIYCFHEGIYEGQFEYDLRHGHGLMRYNDGSEYDGEWQNDQRHGQGKIIYANQTTYVGSWFHNLRHGKGSMDYLGGATYDGPWELDREHGPDGIYTDVNIRYAYRGDWAGGRKEGRGVETTAHGAYEGEFKANMRHGLGRETLKCGTVYEGRWKEDRKCGEGTRQILNGAPEVQHWKDGHLVENDETVAPDLPLLQRR